MVPDHLIIIGRGPAGLSAGIYAGRAGIATTVIGCSPKVAGDYDDDKQQTNIPGVFAAG